MDGILLEDFSQIKMIPGGFLCFIKKNINKNTPSWISLWVLKKYYI
jgi:hypothetical protein